MTAGGIWAPLVGTFYLVFISLAVAAPIGVLAGVYLNEYAGDHWGTRIVNMAVVNLAGVPSIVHALFGVGAFVLFAGMGRSVLAAACTLAIMTLPVIITSTREALAVGAAVVPRSLLEHGGQPLADDPHDRPAECDQRHPDRRDPAGVARGRRNRADPVHRRRLLRRGAGPGAGLLLPLRSVGPAAWRCRITCSPISTQVTGVSESLQYGTAVVLIGLVISVNLLSIAFRVYLRARKRW